MFVEIRKKGENKKYYLVHSFRDADKVLKIRRYLGRNISDSELKLKKEKAEEYVKEQIKQYNEIRDPLKTILSNTELKQLNSLERKFDFKIYPLTENQWIKFSELFSYNTNAIEGSTLTQKEVANIIEGRKYPEKSKEDIAEAKGVAEAIKFIRKTKTHISLDFLKKIHYIVFKKSKSFAGKFREKNVEVVIRDKYGNIVHRGAPSNHVIYLLKELIQWYNENKKKYPPILLAAIVHNQFENIHPFQDGNGRVGRILLNNILLKHSMPPVDIEFENRQKYYNALQLYQNQGNIRPTIELILTEYKKLNKKLKR